MKLHPCIISILKVAQTYKKKKGGGSTVNQGSH